MKPCRPYAAQVSDLVPRSGVVAAWATAYLRERVSLDGAVTGILAGGPTHRIIADGEEWAWALVLGRLRRDGVTSLRLYLPAPGDVAGLPGPADLSRRALSAGEVVVTCDGRPSALLPTPSDDGHLIWEWRPVDTSRPWDTTVGQATRDFVQAITDGADELERLDLAAGRDEVAASLAAVDAALSGLVLPSSHPARAVELIARSTRLFGALVIAQSREGAAVSAGEVGARSRALAPLVRAARHAMAAGYSAGAATVEAR